MNVEQDPSIFAALDLGSNSFHLLVARCSHGRLEIIDRHKEMVRLASGLRSDGTLSEDAIDRALDSLTRFAERLLSTPNAHIHIVGTNTLRAASNSDTFLLQAEKVLGAPINIISGIEEARLIYRGVVHDLSATEKKRLVVDIGGGSTELIVGSVKPLQLESLYMGCVSFTNRFFPNGKITTKNYRRAVLGAQDEVQAVGVAFGAHQWSEAVGTSGTIRGILAILEAMNLSPEHTISLEGLNSLAEKICEFEHIDEISLPGLSDDRRPVIIGGLAVLHGVFKELNIEQMQVSAFAIREGIILDMAGAFEDLDIRKETVAWMVDQYRVDKAQSVRVAKLVCRLFKQVKSDFGFEYQKSKKLVSWAAEMHEVGLSISHASHNKHSAYLLQHSEMPGFSRQEQKLLSFLVLNHRRKLRPMTKTYGFNPDWRLVQIIRLACLFSRRRSDDAIPEELEIKFTDKGMQLTLSRHWLELHPLTAESLSSEQAYLSGQEIELEIVSR